MRVADEYMDQVARAWGELVDEDDRNKKINDLVESWNKHQNEKTVTSGEIYGKREICDHEWMRTAPRDKFVTCCKCMISKAG